MYIPSYLSLAMTCNNLASSKGFKWVWAEEEPGIHCSSLIETHLYYSVTSQTKLLHDFCHHCNAESVQEYDIYKIPRIVGILGTCANNRYQALLPAHTQIELGDKARLVNFLAVKAVV